MRTLIALLLSLLLAPAWAQVPMTGAGKGTPGAAASYQGPGDIYTTGVVAWWGSRAFSAATRGTKALEACDSSGGACKDVFTDATTGALVPQTGIGTGSITCPGHANCIVRQWYDQSGANSCTVGGVAGQPCHVGQAVPTNMPFLTASGSVQSNSAGPRQLKCNGLGPTCTLTSGTAQPYTVAAVAKRTSGTTQAMYFSDSGNMATGMDAANTVGGYCSVNATQAGATDNVFHAVQTLCNGASGQFYIDGSGTTKNLGTSALGTGVGGFFIGTDPYANRFNGEINEVGIWAGDKSASFSAVNANQHAFWGF